MTGPPARCAGRRATAGLLAGLLFGLWPAAPALAQEGAGERLGRVQAAFLRNFARYIGWPASAFAAERTPWHVCILGAEHLDDSLEQTLHDRIEQGRGFTVLRADSLQRLPVCQIVFVGFDSTSRRREVLAQLRGQPVLTVGQSPEFLAEGGIVRLLPGERVAMSINLDQARAASLSIPAKLLEVSQEVVENGAPRRWR